MSDKRILGFRFGLAPLSPAPPATEAAVREWLDARRIERALKVEERAAYERWLEAYRRVQYAEAAVSCAIPHGVRHEVDGLVVRRAFLPDGDRVVIEGKRKDPRGQS